MPLPRLKWPSQWRLPRYLSGIPLPALRLIALLVLINGIVWAAAGILLRGCPCTTTTEARDTDLKPSRLLPQTHLPCSPVLHPRPAPRPRRRRTSPHLHLSPSC